MVTIERRIVSIFWARSSISFEHMSFWCPFLDPHLTTCHANIGVQIIAMSELVTSSLSITRHCVDLCIIIGIACNWLRCTPVGVRWPDSLMDADISFAAEFISVWGIQIIFCIIYRNVCWQFWFYWLAYRDYLSKTCKVDSAKTNIPPKTNALKSRTISVYWLWECPSPQRQAPIMILGNLPKNLWVLNKFCIRN